MESPKIGRSRSTPFYQTSEKVQTSAQIVKEARTLLKNSNLRPTRRPETPQEKQRSLFDSHSIYDPSNRPPSSFSLNSRHFESESRPVSGLRLPPIEHKSISEEEVLKSPKPPLDPNRPPRISSGKSRSVQHSISVDPDASNLVNIPLSAEDTHNVGISNRRIHSGPKERTSSLFNDNLTDYTVYGEEPVSARRANSGGQARKGARPTSLNMPDNSNANNDQHSMTVTPVSTPLSDSSLHSYTGGGSDIDSPSSTKVEANAYDTPVKNRHYTTTEEDDKRVQRVRRDKGKEEVDTITKDSRKYQNVKVVKKPETNDSLKKSNSGKKQSASIDDLTDQRIGSAGKRDEESEEESQLYDDVLVPILKEMTAISRNASEGAVDHLIELSDQLFKVMSQHNLLGKNCKRRSAVLKILFKLIDMDSPQLLVKLATVILSLKVSGNNLINICKLIFMVCKNPANDDIVLQENIPDLLLEVVESCDVCSSLDALVYLVGSLKFLSSNTVAVKRLVKRRLVRILGSLLHSINKAKSRNILLNEQSIGPVLVQVTATLRNSADVQGVWSQFLEAQLINELFSILNLYSEDSDLALNVTRIFSKLSSHSDCCRVLSSHQNYFNTLINLLRLHKQREDLVVRVAFILGNVTARDESSRQSLISHENHLNIILDVLHYYFDADLKNNNGQKNDSKYEDVLVKLVRVIANLSISEQIGPQIASSEKCVALLQHILDNKELTVSEELVLNTITAINNLSYFDIESSAVIKAQVHLAAGLVKYVNNNHSEGQCEATRVLGNLSRSRSVRDLLMQHEVGEKLMDMLASSESEVVYTSCGVLINLMLDEDKRFLLRKQENSGVSLLLDVLQSFAHSDWLLATLVCQVLWNYCSRVNNISQWLGWQQAQQLATLLEDYLDEENIREKTGTLSEEEEEMQEYVLEQWRSEFCPVATGLLAKLESSLPDLEPL